MGRESTQQGLYITIGKSVWLNYKRSQSLASRSPEADTARCLGAVVRQNENIRELSILLPASGSGILIERIKTGSRLAAFAGTRVTITVIVAVTIPLFKLLFVYILCGIVTAFISEDIIVLVLSLSIVEADSVSVIIARFKPGVVAITITVLISMLLSFGYTVVRISFNALNDL